MRGAARARALQLRLTRRDVVNRDDRGVVGFIDVGSDGGLPEPWRSNANAIRNVLSFEPLSSGDADPNVTIVPAALWRSAETRPFYIQRGSSHGNSLYPPNLDYVRENFNRLKHRGPRALAETWLERSTISRTETLDTTTLDAVLEDVGGRFEFLKVDAQGADYDVLVGAQRFLETDCLGVQLEAFTIPLYEGITLLEAIDEHMEQLGFHRAWTAPPHGTVDSQHDVLYLRSNASPSPALAAIKNTYRI